MLNDSEDATMLRIKYPMLEDYLNALNKYYTNNGSMVVAIKSINYINSMDEDDVFLIGENLSDDNNDLVRNLVGYIYMRGNNA